MQVDTDFELDLSIEHKEASCNKIDDVVFDSRIYAHCFLEDVFDNSASINFELVSMGYFVGYVAFKVIPKLQCERCSDEKKMDVVLTAPSELFIYFKNYQSLTDFGKLVAPLDKIIKCLKLSLKKLV